MKISQILSSVGFAAVLASSASASVTFSGNALLNVTGLNVGDVGIFLVDNNGSNFSSFSIDLNDSLTDAATYGNYTVLGSKTASSISTNKFLSGAFSGVNLDANVTTGDRFAVVVFDTSTTTAQANDTWRVFTDATWVVPADGSLLSYAASPTGSNFKQLGVSATPILTGTVAGAAIPEASSFAAIAGLMAVGFASVRRRRS